MLLILTSRQDLTADYLITQLRLRGYRYFRLNSDELTQADPNLHLTPGFSRRSLSVNGKDVDLETVQAVWYRRALRPPLSPNIASETRAAVADELRHLYEGLVQDSHLTWVNSIPATMIAERKIYQLRLATELGFPIPETIVSHSAETIRRFSSRAAHGLVAKPLYHGLWGTPQGVKAVYTEDLVADELPTDGELRDCPFLVQARLPKDADIRVTCVGSSMFGAQIEVENPCSVDWRHPAHRVRYKTTDLPRSVTDFCAQMMFRLSLNYGAFDFARVPDGQWYFLEVNPAGEWVWLERELNIPISAALIQQFFGQTK